MGDHDEISTPPPDPGEVAPEVERVQGHWERLVDDMAATAEDYREGGWTVLEVHPGDIAAIGPGRTDRWGLELLVPDDEFRELERWTGGAAHGFDSCEVLRGAAGGLEYLVIAVLDDETQRVLLFPAYYDTSLAAEMLEAAHSAGELPTHLRPLTGEPVVTITIDDLDLVLPEDWSAPADE